MVFRIALPQNTEAELQAFEDTCERLGGFSDDFDAERVEGFLTSLAALPQVPAEAEWMAALFGETFERVFADPEDRAAALRSVRRRLQVLCAQLDAQALFDDPGSLRMEPMVHEWTDADRQQLVEEGSLSAEAAAAVQTGSFWADGFMAGVHSFRERWAVPSDEDAATLFQQSLAHIAALMLEPGGEPLRAHLAEAYPEGPVPGREQLFAEACWSVQDLRMYWVDFAPRGSTRRVEPTPGRNDPCPCGSGKKYKKCHGTA